MPRQNLTAEFKTFIKGIITEVTPLTFPDNASLDETNFVLNRDGSRYRRLGVVAEDINSTLTLGGASASSGLFSSYLWKDGKGLGDGDILVVNAGTYLYFFGTDGDTVGDDLIEKIDLGVTTVDADSSSFAKIGKYLVFARGEESLRYFNYSDNDELVEGTFRLQIRDFFGVDDYDTDGTDLTDSTGLLRRPTVKTDNHIYNLRNQSWAHKYTSKATGAYADPIASWRSVYSQYPANSDITTRAVYADTGDDDDRTLERFWETHLYKTDYGSGEPPRGSFIIDFVTRSASRLAKIQALEDEKNLSYPVTALPTEYEYGSAKSMAAYSGRLFYSGFPGSYSENSKSPNTESFILFSQLIDTPSQFGRCYQEGDPTGKEDYDLLATDGGYLQVEDAYNIHTLLTTSSGLIAIAENGVWLVAGGSGYGFSADNYIVQRLSDKGAISASSVVKVDETIMYWSDEGIFQVAPNQYGDLASTNISKETIQSLYEEIPYANKERCYGVYDPYTLKVKWVYGYTGLSSSDKTEELILDTSLGAFSRSTYENYGDYGIYMPILVPPYSVTESEATVTDQNGDVVTDISSDIVYTLESVRETGYNGIKYLAFYADTHFTFCTLSHASFKDWVGTDGVGVDAAAYLLTGYFNGGDIMRQKQAGKIITYARRSESGFEEDSETGDWNAVNPSSCLITPRWDWTDNAVAGKWGNPVQGYRLKRQYFPSSISDSFDNGEPVVVTQNKLRGRGRVLSLKIETEEEKDLQLLGWAMVINVNGAG